MPTNADLLKVLKSAGRAQFYLCDLHVHSPASPDVRCGDRFKQLSEEEQELLAQVPEAAANDPVSYEKEVLSAFPVSRYYELLIERRDALAQQESILQGEDWAFVAITDHNVCNYSADLAKYAWEFRGNSRLIVLPGMELDVSFPVNRKDRTDAHIILIYPPGIQTSDIRVAIHDLAANTWTFGKTAEVDSLPEFVHGLRNHTNYPAIAIAAHIASEKGLRGAVRKVREEDTFTNLDAAIARTLAELEHGPDADKQALSSRLGQLKKDRNQEAEQISLDVLTLVGACGFDGLQVSCKLDESHYRRLHRFRTAFGRGVPLVASDAHRIDDIFVCEGNLPYLKLPVMSTSATLEDVFSSVRHAIRYGETRFSYATPAQVTRWISGLRIIPDRDDASRFWPFNAKDGEPESFVLPFSRNLNCLVGGRGSGKSAAIEAIAFITEPTKFDGVQHKRNDALLDWYGCAKATLASCRVQLVWQIAGSTTDLPKGALFSERYFNPSGDHGSVTHTNADNKEVLGSAIESEPPQIFRARQIENSAAPSKLRELFDTLVGERIPALEQEIADLRRELAEQREDMANIAHQIMELTEEDAPLREHCRRKVAYEAVNRKEVQPFYKRLDEASGGESLAQGAKQRWEKAVGDARIAKVRSSLLEELDRVAKKIKSKSGEIKPCCQDIAKLFAKGKDGLSPRDRLANAIEDVEKKIDAVGILLEAAVAGSAAEHRKAREALGKKGLPSGAKDREVKKQEFKQAENDLEEYREFLQQWEDSIHARNRKFQTLVEKCRERTKLRTETAERLCSQLAQDLDSSVLVIKVEVHPMEDRSALRKWLVDHIRSTIPSSKEARIDAILDKKKLIPEKIRDTLLGEAKDGAAIFEVNRESARDGRVEPDLAKKILEECSGKIRLGPEHMSMKDMPSAECIKALPPEIRDGLWTFPPTEPDSDTLVVDGVLGLDEVVFDDRPEILLNDRPQEKGSTLRPIGELSPGQRCSAILPILLLNGRSPLIIDQPEDNLDNRLIRQVIVNILASIKLRRQVIIATHNPNLPVLGDVEQAIVLRAVEEKQSLLESTGDLDSPDTVAHLTEIMEGGREAFQYRQSIYQAHWGGSIAPA